MNIVAPARRAPRNEHGTQAFAIPKRQTISDRSSWLGLSRRDSKLSVVL
jgi:hypothetical protein